MGAYHFTCRMRGAPITMPSECLTCTAMGTKSGYQGSTQLDVTGNDIVFILRESKCLNAKTVGKFLRKFFKSKIMEPPSKKSKQNNYYRVGYGGPGGLKDPHTYTLTTKDNKISTDKKNEVAKRIKHVIASADGTPSDGLHAVSYATKLQFRAGARQILIHLSCDGCSADSVRSQSEVDQALREKQISYHHMPLKSIVAKKKGALYGQIMQDSNDACIAVASSPLGAVWDSSLGSKSKDFMAVFKTTLHEKLPQLGRQSCTCVIDEFGESVSRCVSA